MNKLLMKVLDVVLNELYIRKATISITLYTYAITQYLCFVICCRSAEKPFKFYQREEAKKRQKINEAIYEGRTKSKKPETFKAKPIPRMVCA